MVMMVCSNCSARRIPNVIDNLSMEILELFQFASVICIMRER